jgi:hypothetical protein
MNHFELHINRKLPQIAALAGVLAVSAGVDGCAKPSGPERPGQVLGQQSASNAPARRQQGPKRPVRKTKRRHDLDRDNVSLAPPRTLPIPGSGSDPTAVGPRGVLPDPYANPQ